MAVPMEINLAVIPGDGIGPEVISATLSVLDALEAHVGGFRLNRQYLQAGAGFYKETGEDISEEAFATACNADAILLGAIGLPDVRYPDGTEITPHLRLRQTLGLFAGIRPVKAFPNTLRRLADPQAKNIDFVIIRESTEGLFYSHGKGEVIGDQEARETLRITRTTCENLFDSAFQLARRRKAQGRKGEVTCVDKANVFRSMVFFRKIFKERAALHPDIDVSYSYVDAQALDLIRQPWNFDILVMENMFGDILSDMGGGLVGGMGMAPCAELGLTHGLFQPAHGSAPDIAGTGKANPTATLLSAALMLDWLGSKHDITEMVTAAAILDTAIYDAFASKRIWPYEFGGTDETAAIADTIVDIIQTPVSDVRECG